MKTTRQNLVLATAIAVATALGLSACNKNNSSPDNVPPAAMSSGKPAMPPVSEPPPMGPSSSATPAQPATTGSVGTH